MKGRWEDWAAIAVGLALASSWTWHGMLGPEMGALLLLGVGAVFAATMSITRPGAVSTELFQTGIGLLVFLSPWLMGFTGIPPAAWTAWILGAVLALVGGFGVVLAGRARRSDEELAWGHQGESQQPAP